MATVPHPPWIADGPVSIICQNCKSQFPWHTNDCMYTEYKPAAVDTSENQIRTIFITKGLFSELRTLADATRENVDAIAARAIRKYLDECP